MELGYIRHESFVIEIGNGGLRKGLLARGYTSLGRIRTTGPDGNYDKCYEYKGNNDPGD